MSFDLEGFADACEAAETQEEVTALVARAVERRGEVLAALGPVEEQMTRTFHASPERTVQIIAWAPGMRAAPHEHRMWAVIGVCAGREDNGRWRRAGRGIERAGGDSLGEGEVLALDDQVIHDVANPLDAFTVAIHVYGGDILRAARSMWHPFTMEEVPFDTEKVERLVAAFNARQRMEPVPFAAANVPRIMAAILEETKLGRA